MSVAAEHLVALYIGAGLKVIAAFELQNFTLRELQRRVHPFLNTAAAVLRDGADFRRLGVEQEAGVLMQ